MSIAGPRVSLFGDVDLSTAGIVEDRVPSSAILSTTSAMSSRGSDGLSSSTAVGGQQKAVRWLQLDRGVDKLWIGRRAQQQAVSSDALDGSIRP